jgi:hypothetical protein
MNFEGFIDDCRSQWPGFDTISILETLVHPVDRSHSAILSKVPGMATENKLKLLSLAVANLNADEIYVEIGTWRGATLVGALVGNPNARLFACDNFSEFEGNQALLEDTIRRHAIPGQVSFSNMDFGAFLKLAPWRPSRVGAYFYDGGHSFLDQYNALALMVPHLANDALIIVDDTNWAEVRAANRYFMRRVPELELVADIRTRELTSQSWWNGVQIFRYRGSPLISVPNDTSFALNCHNAFWQSHRYLPGIPGSRRLIKFISLRTRELPKVLARRAR